MSKNMQRNPNQPILRVSCIAYILIIFRFFWLKKQGRVFSDFISAYGNKSLVIKYKTVPGRMPQVRTACNLYFWLYFSWWYLSPSSASSCILIALLSEGLSLLLAKAEIINKSRKGLDLVWFLFSLIFLKAIGAWLNPFTAFIYEWAAIQDFFEDVFPLFYSISL